MKRQRRFLFFFFFNDTATTEIYTLSLHDALPIFGVRNSWAISAENCERRTNESSRRSSIWSKATADRKSTRLNSSHGYISYAVFCLKKKKHTSFPNSLLPDEHSQHRRVATCTSYS